MIDIGANMLHSQFDGDRAAALTRARDAGVQELVITATDVDTAEQAATFAANQRDDWPRLYCTAGVHPHDAANVGEDYVSRLRDVAAHECVVAVGETGLDFHRNFSPPAAQRRVFEDQLALATELEQTLFVHDRDSDGETYAALQSSGLPAEKIIVHCFTGTGEDLDRYLDAGYWVGITGWVCDKRRGKDLRHIVTRIPLDRLLIETDAPFLLPHNVPKDAPVQPNGRRNEPALLRWVAQQLAALFDVDEQTLAETTATNARCAFSLPTAAS